MTHPCLSDDEEALLRSVRMVAEVARRNAARVPAQQLRYPGGASLLLRYGRLFTAGPALPPEQLGRPGLCWFNAAGYAQDHPDAVYVEGLAVHPSPAGLGLDQPHAWCAAGTTAIEPSPGWAEGTLYLGIPFATDYLLSLGRRHGLGSLIWAPSPAALELYRDGIPVEGLADVGRPLPQLDRPRQAQG